MKLTEESLQQIAEQLETGESLESSIAGLPAQEADIVRLMAALRAVPFPEEEEAVVTAQEALVLAALKEQASAPTRPRELDWAAIAGAASGVKERFRRWMGQGDVGLGVASALLLLLLVVWLGWSLGRSQEEQGVAIAPVEEKVTTDVESGSTGGEPGMPAPAAESGVEEETVIAANPPPDRGPSIYLPLVSDMPEANAVAAVVDDVQGMVEIERDGGGWTVVRTRGTLLAGQRVRTGEFSQVRLTFYDGSQAFMGASTEISVDELNALRPEDGFRTVVLTQHAGESRHRVQFRNDAGSRYEVRTPAGVGVARGTSFRVLVTTDQVVRYSVSEGKVDVTGQNRTVSVTAGQLTTLIAGSVPDDPVFSISGEGEVEATGSVWTIAGQTFQTHAYTVIVGNPQVGDLVRVDGHLLADGGRVADRIILLRRAIVNRFSLTGEVEEKGATWKIAGQTILINQETDLDEGIEVGDTVRVDGVILPGGGLLAERIALEDAMPGLPFRFSGVVQAIGDALWQISGRAIAVDDDSDIDDGIRTGDVVVVRGWILADNTWLASKIERRREVLPSFEFTGAVQSIDPWVVAGIGFETRQWTDVSPGIAIGDRVRVSGTILADGTRVAASITLLRENEPNILVFVGRVGSINPWVVNGLQLVITGDSQITGDINVGTLVIVQVQLLPDGTWSVLTIRPLHPTFGIGCLIFSSPVISVDGDDIRVRHWNIDIKRDGRIKIHGDIKVNSVLSVPLCIGWDGTILIIGDIIVIYQPIVVIIDTGDGLPDGCRITGKGSIKCSKRSER